MNTLTFKKLGLLAAVSAGALAAAPAWSATAACGSGSTISTAQVDTAATCQSWGAVPAQAPNTGSVNEIWGVATTIDYKVGNMDLVSFNNQLVGPALNNSEPFQSPLQIANLNPALSYLVFLYETSSAGRDWMVVTALGQAIIDGLEYVEATSQGTAKYEIRVFSVVSSPSTLALLSLGLAGLAVMRRKSVR